MKRDYASVTGGLLVAVLTATTMTMGCVEALNVKKLFRFGARSMPKSESTSPPLLTRENGKFFPEKDIATIFDQNQNWKNKKLETDPAFFDKLGSGHYPDYMWIGCADARVPETEITGVDPGSIFVVRNVANMVVNTDFNLMAALQYGVGVLKVKHVIVCGHYDCGGIRASVEAKDHVPPLENWLRNIRDVYRLHKDELDRIKDPEQRHRRLVELNVIEQCVNLFKTGVVQRERVRTYKENQKRKLEASESSTATPLYTTPRIHACVFDPKTGDMKTLDVNFSDYIDELHDIYDLYTLGEDDVIENRPHAPTKL